MARDPKKITQIRNLIQEIKAKCYPEESDDGCARRNKKSARAMHDRPYLDQLEELEVWVESGAWSWPPRLKEVPAEKINRCGDVLKGPLYTCKGYEWPMHKKVPMIPFIQLDLGRCSRVSRVDFGTGLLQVWFGYDLFMGEDAFIRVVPADQVHKSKLLPLPAFNMKKIRNASPANINWADTESIFREKAIQITSYKPRRFTIPYINTYDVECDEQSDGLSKDCKRMIKRLNSMIDHACERFGTGLHLMGTFASVQYSPDEAPTPLFCFDGEGSECYNFGDGNGQLFFVKGRNGKISFQLSWSCL